MLENIDAKDQIGQNYVCPGKHTESSFIRFDNVALSATDKIIYCSDIRVLHVCK